MVAVGATSGDFAGICRGVLSWLLLDEDLRVAAATRLGMDCLRRWARRGVRPHCGGADQLVRASDALCGDLFGRRVVLNSDLGKDLVAQ